MDLKIRFLKVVVTVLSFESVLSTSKYECDSLSYRTGVETHCENPVTKESIDCIREKVPIGTTATYKCEPFYVTNNDGSDYAQMKCDRGGQWTHRGKFQAFSCVMDCGRSFPDSTSTKWPWYAGIFVRQSPDYNFRFQCGGTLIRPYSAEPLVLTSKSCVMNRDFQLAAQNVEVRMGIVSYDTNRQNSRSGEMFTVKNILTSKYSNPLALIQLSRRPILSKNILPACLNLNRGFVEYQFQQPGSAQVVGFGNSAKFRNHLRNISIELAQSGKCRTGNPRASWNGLCAGKGAKICAGDLGSGILMSHFSANSIRHFVQGVLREPQNKCTDYATFSRISDYSDWITKSAASLVEQPANGNLNVLKEPGIGDNRHREVATKSKPKEQIPTQQTNIKDYEATAIEFHNLYRRKHGVGPVKLSTQLSQLAQEEAERSLSTNRYKFEGFTNWFGVRGANYGFKQLVEQSIKDWYKTSASYHYDSPTPLPFVQIVWKGTTEIGVGVAQFGEKQVVVVKYNRPPVTFLEEQRSYQENVLRPV